MQDKTQEHGDDSCDHSRSVLWTVFGGTALVLALAGLVVNLPSIRRYIRISMM
jgi:hypothetical protein